MYFKIEVKVKQRKLAPQDEISRASTYWPDGGKYHLLPSSKRQEIVSSIQVSM